MKKIVSIAVAMAAALTPAAAVSQSHYIQLRFFWYADEYSTTIVGEDILYCDGTRHRWGEATAYPGETENNVC